MGLGAARTIPIAWLVPAFGGANLPAFVRLGLGLCLSLLCLPRTVGFVAPTDGVAFWFLLLLREAAVGFTVGFVASCVFRAAEMAGRLTDILRGANMAEVLSPVSEGRTSPLGDVSLMLVVLLFLEMGGVGQLALALSESYDAVPLGGPKVVAALGGVVQVAVFASARLMISAVSLAAPALVAMLLVDLVLGAVARLAPQLPVFFIGMPLKALGGVGLVLVSLASLQAALTGELRTWVTLVRRAFGVWS